MTITYADLPRPTVKPPTWCACPSELCSRPAGHSGSGLCGSCEGSDRCTGAEPEHVCDCGRVFAYRSRLLRHAKRCAQSRERTRP